MEYKIFEAENKEDLEKTIKDSLNNGWEVQGGVSVIFFKHPD